MITFTLIIIAAGILLKIGHSIGFLRVEVPFAINIKQIWYDFSMPFSKMGRKLILIENHCKHFSISALIAFAVVMTFRIFEWMQFQNFTIAETCILMWGLTLLINAVREKIKQTSGGKYPDTDVYFPNAGKWIVKFDWRDVRYGGYGGIAGGALGFLISNMI